MNCKQHPETPGVAVCQGCGAILCAKCSNHLISGKHYCSEACAGIIVAEQKTISELVNKARTGYKLLPIITTSMGTLFIISGLSSLILGTFRRVDFMIIVAGITFIIIGIFIKRAIKSCA